MASNDDLLTVVAKDLVVTIAAFGMIWILIGPATAMQLIAAATSALWIGFLVKRNDNSI